MSDLILYKRMYFQLFNEVTSAVAVLNFAEQGIKAGTDMEKERKLEIVEEAIEIAIRGLRKAQQEVERMYIEG